MNKITDYIKNPSMILAHFIRGKAKWMSDEMYLKIMYRANIGKKLNLKNPRTYTEKMQWLKLYDHKSIYTRMVDKYGVKGFVAERIGELYTVQTIGVFDSFEEIDFGTLPNKFVIKCTHDSHSILICRNKETFDIEGARNRLNACLKENYFWKGREWPYRNVVPRIIIEKMLCEDPNDHLEEYDFFCFDGEPKIVCRCWGDRDRGEAHYNDFYSIDGERLPFSWCYPTSEDGKLVKDEIYHQMLSYSRSLSEGLPFLRVDFFRDENDRIYVGELTFYECSGLTKVHPPEWDEILGSWIQLPEIS